MARIWTLCGLLVFFGVGCTAFGIADTAKSVAYEPAQGQLANWSYQIIKAKTINDQLVKYEIHAQYTGTEKGVDSAVIQFGNASITVASVKSDTPVVMGSTFPKTENHTSLTIKWTVGSFTQSQTIEVKLP